MRVCAEFSYELCHILWQRCLKEHLLLGARVNEAQCAGVQSLSRADVEGITHKGLVAGGGLSAQDFHAAIALIGEERMAYALHVRADLMRPPCLQHTFHPCDRSKGFQYTPMGDGGLAYLAFWREYRHALTVARVAGDVPFDAAFRRVKASPYEGVVLPACALDEELVTEVCLGLWCLGHQPAFPCSCPHPDAPPVPRACSPPAGHRLRR